MLTHLQIRDFAIVDALELDFTRGLTVLTGETGAGKSLVVDALTIAAGARAGADQIRAGAERAEVAARFDLSKAPASLRALLDEQAIETDDELLVRRVISADGRSRAFLNGQAVTLQILRDAVGALVDVHGQHEFQSLVRPAAQRELLDEFGRLGAQVAVVKAAYKDWSALRERQRDLEQKAGERESRLDLLRFQEAEFDALSLRPGEHAELKAESQKLANAGRLLSSAQGALQRLYEGDEGTAHEALAQAIALLKPLAGIDPELAALLPLLEEAQIRVGESARELSRYADALDLDSGRQADVEQRLATIEDLARKHRVTADELIDRHEALRGEREALERADSDLGALRGEIAAALARYRSSAKLLSQGRQDGARALGDDITRRMQGLGMNGGRFQIDVTTQADADPQANGADGIEFQVSANPGQPLRPLAKVASGGELARLSLAVQVACTADDQRCMVFDEVDSGIGGAVAEIVGRELRSLGERAQVLCVTHLAQVASQGHQHLRVLKLTDGRSTRTGITALAGDERVTEIARMLGGLNIGERAQAHAREMLDSAAAKPAPKAAAKPRKAAAKRS